MQSNELSLFYGSLQRELVENKVADSRGRLNQMIDSTKGEDKEILSEVGFKTAKPLLDKKI